MAERILADTWRHGGRPDDGLLMTTTDAAKYLGVTREAMRQFGQSGAVPSVPTSSPRIRLFVKGVLRVVNEARAEARYRRGLRALREVHPVMLKAGMKPRQFDLFGPALRVVSRRSLGKCQVTTARTFQKVRESDTSHYVAQRAAGGRRR